ncbi:hypothetical protein BDW42DRAFT_180493 [Aspergillus taichungensis]|uniref:Uncharacterized protein n=1 Tax=Aspergillus taichungensis TaxID=482145 RepID=A0A2J5HF88_9EURO|nr:hypothetical protein BDW42DRAFT_180493 [Aspergillus taichungensis]
MFTKSSLLLALTGGALVAAAPQGFQSTNSPCAQVSKQYAKAVKSNDPEPKVPGALAHECLLSMPFESKKAVAFVDDLRKYLQWQSTVDVMENPPTTYPGPPVDLWGGLDYIQQQARAGDFTSQYEFDNAIMEHFNSAKEGHLSIYPCSAGVFMFQVDQQLVSVSSDGFELPEVYTLNDAQVLQEKPNAVSPVVKINGADVNKHLNDVADKMRYQDPDARYNDLFHSFARYTGITAGGFATNDDGAWPGANEFILAHANGTTTKAKVNAIVGSDFNYADGKAFYEAMCLPQSPSSSAAASQTPTSTPTSTLTSTPTPSSTSAAGQPPTNYPKAAVRDHNNLLSGYLLDEPDLKDVAVLRVPTFMVKKKEKKTSIVTSLANKFISKAVKADKKKIVIDMTANPGGDLEYATGLFKAFFPNKTPYLSTRMRAHDALYLAEKVIYSLPKDSLIYAQASMGGFGSFTKPDQSGDLTLKQFYGPHNILGSNMTSASSLDLDVLSTKQNPIQGYGGIELAHDKPPFAPEDILILTDGACSSACPMFTQMMENEGVKTIAFGGRPQYGPMQAMGGTRGTHAGESLMIKTVMSLALQHAKTHAGVLSADEIKTLEALSPAKTSPLNMQSMRVNLRDGFHRSDKESEMPLQFVYQPAHCRLFYTIENIFHPETTWSAAVRAMWGGGDCVAGSRQ